MRRSENIAANSETTCPLSRTRRHATRTCTRASARTRTFRNPPPNAPRFLVMPLTLSVSHTTRPLRLTIAVVACASALISRIRLCTLRSLRSRLRFEPAPRLAPLQSRQPSKRTLQRFRIRDAVRTHRQRLDANIHAERPTASGGRTFVDPLRASLRHVAGFGARSATSGKIGKRRGRDRRRPAAPRRRQSVACDNPRADPTGDATRTRNRGSLLASGQGDAPEAAAAPRLRDESFSRASHRWHSTRSGPSTAAPGRSAAHSALASGQRG